LRGTYDNRIELKKRNRLAEQALCSAECLAAIAFSKGRPYPRGALQELWEKLLFSQFHDIIGGSNSDPVYLAAIDRLQSVLTGSGEIADTALRQIAPGMGKAGEWGIVCNSLSFPRTELCRMSVPGP